MVNFRSINTAGFGPWEINEKEPNSKEAMTLMKEVVEDPALIKVLEKHNWKVGRVKELHHRNSSGRLLGWNMNAGSVISLRLRRQSGVFLPLDSIMGTMFHELAHNDIAPHNKKFVELNRLVETEYYEFKSKLSNAKVFPGKGNRLQRKKRKVPRGANAAEMARRRALERMQIFSGTGHRLGGNLQSEPGLSAREMAARATLARLSLIEKRQINGCGCKEIDPEIEALMKIPDIDCPPSPPSNINNIPDVDCPPSPVGSMWSENKGSCDQKVFDQPASHQAILEEKKYGTDSDLEEKQSQLSETIEGSNLGYGVESRKRPRSPENDNVNVSDNKMQKLDQSLWNELSFTLSSCKLLVRILENLVSHPKDPKFRAINTVKVKPKMTEEDWKKLQGVGFLCGDPLTIYPGAAEGQGNLLPGKVNEALTASLVRLVDLEEVLGGR